VWMTYSTSLVQYPTTAGLTKKRVYIYNRLGGSTPMMIGVNSLVLENS